MAKYILYSHAGSENHGCEALLRTSIMTIQDIDCVYTGDVRADKKYQLDKLVELREDKKEGFDSTLSKVIYYIRYHITKSDELFFRNIYRNFIHNIEKDKIYISIGGDNYCYHYSIWLEVLNDAINKKGAKSVLWGCSINADELKSYRLLKDLAKYSLITARETETYDLLCNALPNTTIKYVPDTAFLLPVKSKNLPNGFLRGKTIGLNVSPVATKNASKGEELISYIVDMVNYIISNTEYQIALIPHVVIDKNDDREVLREIYNKCKDKTRVVLIEDDNCMILKGYISQCELFIGARTHSTIAAYSTCVPTMVLGYSIKARGIAKDLFGTDNNYVLPVQDISSSRELINAFNWLNDNRVEIKTILNERMPDYIQQIYTGIECLREI